MRRGSRIPWTTRVLKVSIVISWSLLGGVSMLLNMCRYDDLSSPFLFVFVDNRVTCHTRAYVVSGDVGDA